MNQSALDLADVTAATHTFTKLGGEVLAPGSPTDPVQIIDSRDLAEWTIRMIENKETGIYNATGPQTRLSMAEMLYGIKAVTTAGAQFTWVPADFLTEHQVRGWRHMPVWVPFTANMAAFSDRSVVKAVTKGLTFRPLAVTAKDTLDWHKTRPEAEQKTLAEGGMAALAETFAPQGYNVGWNLGRIAGAGIVDHVHLHVVPRWAGDTNFMPVLADVKVLPEHLLDTARRLRDSWPR